MALTEHDARNAAINLVKQAFSTNILHPAPTADWIGNPTEAGKRLGEYIASAVETLTKELQK